MLLSLGNLITIAVVVLVLVAFRIVDSRNRPSVEKLKRQSDMLTEKFSTFVEERTTEVRALSSTFHAGGEVNVYADIQGENFKDVIELVLACSARRSSLERTFDGSGARTPMR